MKQKFLSILIALTAIICSHAYAQYGIPYQAIARNSSGSILANQAIGLRFSIRDSFATGTILYTETFNTTTDAEGLFNVNVGTGTVVSGNFNTISWGAGAKFMQMEMDQAGGSSYNNLGTQQLMAVPYALFAKNGMPPGTTGDVLYHDGTNWQKLPVGTNGQMLSVQNGVPKWSTLTELFRPTVRTGTTPSEVGYTIAKVSYTVDNRGTGTSYTAGIVWGTTRDITYTPAGTNQITSSITGATVTLNALLPSKKYYYRAFAYSYIGADIYLSQGHIDSFTTLSYVVVGQNFLGGKVVYVLQPGEAGYDPWVQHGLIAAPNDLAGSYPYGCLGSPAIFYSETYCTGVSNTSQIAVRCGTTSAANACKNAIISGLGPNIWFLPNKIDLSKMYLARDLIGGFSPAVYWSSSENNTTTSFSVNFATGSMSPIVTKNTPAKVRPVTCF